MDTRISAAEGMLKLIYNIIYNIFKSYSFTSFHYYANTATLKLSNFFKLDEVSLFDLTQNYNGITPNAHSAIRTFFLPCSNSLATEIPTPKLVLFLDQLEKKAQAYSRCSW